MTTEAELFDGVVTGEAMPVVVSQYGFKRIEIDGKTFLAAMSRAELLELLTNSRGSAEEAENIVSKMDRFPRCVTTSSRQCAGLGGCTRCSRGYEAGAVWCWCEAD
ncbi:hypothetical protein GCM10007387_24030 [Pseudoduganella albidiflava]|uniref:Uncharacterized protein n=1 Tax=Pseudoduganella albidiflava TaxID=321983 RepID=A0AA87XW83_9BURK|nr:hypothetical protein GCM10007387_24030 [Pseudoduganella albidiflava]